MRFLKTILQFETLEYAMLVHQHGSWLFSSHSSPTAHNKNCICKIIYITQQTMKDMCETEDDIKYFKNKMKGCGLNSLR
jgi:hypothetical protein